LTVQIQSLTRPASSALPVEVFVHLIAIKSVQKKARRKAGFYPAITTFP